MDIKKYISELEERREELMTKADEIHELIMVIERVEKCDPVKASTKDLCDELAKRIVDPEFPFVIGEPWEKFFVALNQFGRGETPVVYKDEPSNQLDGEDPPPYIVEEPPMGHGRGSGDTCPLPLASMKEWREAHFPDVPNPGVKK